MLTMEAIVGQDDLCICDFFQLAMLGKELADQPVHVFTGAAHPAGMGMRKIAVQLQRVRDAFMLREFLAVIGCQGVRFACKGLEFFDDHLTHFCRLLAGDARNQRITAFAFVGREQSLRVTRCKFLRASVEQTARRLRVLAARCARRSGFVRRPSTKQIAPDRSQQCGCDRVRG